MKTVWVIMSNDFPDSVFATLEAANEYVAKKRAEEKAKIPADKQWMTPRIYWRHYEFEVQA